MAELKRAASPVEGAKAVDEKRVKKVKELKFAMLLSYQGSRYLGMQTQGNSTATPQTIEDLLLQTLHTVGLITAAQRARPFQFSFQRAARTDRAVSAVRQVCSMWLPLRMEEVDATIAAMNAHLPGDIRVMGLKRVTKSFHCQKSCSSRTYSYTMPTFAFAPTDALTSSAYRIDEKTLEEVNALMQIFVGTHNFFNYTAHKEHGDRSCVRYLIKFQCESPFIYHDPIRDGEMQFLTVIIHGQSFMLHQIRKMIGMVIAVMRGFVNKSAIQAAWEQERADIPKAPGLGLVLERVHYDWYDKKFAQSHEQLTIWEKCEEKLETFRKERIIEEILRTEAQTQSMMMWLAEMGKHRFVTDPYDGTMPSSSPLATAAHLIKVGEGEGNRQITVKVERERAGEGGDHRDGDHEEDEHGEDDDDDDEPEHSRSEDKAC